MSKFKKVCVICDKEHEVDTKECCTFSSLILKKESNLFSKKVEYYDLDNNKLSEDDLVELKNKETISRDNQRLLIAAEEGFFDYVKEFISKGGNVNHKRNDGVTALMFAAQNGHLGIVKMLIEAGAEVNAEYATGWTALMFAASKGKTAIVECLLNHGADPNVTDDKRFNPLMYAASKRYNDIVSLLEKAGSKSPVGILTCKSCGKSWESTSKIINDLQFSNAKIIGQNSESCPFCGSRL